MWPNLPQLQGLDLAGEIANISGLDVTIENDANAAVIGEHWQGSAKGAQNVIGITLGTGVGGGIIVNGEIFRGASGPKLSSSQTAAEPVSWRMSSETISEVVEVKMKRLCPAPTAASSRLSVPVTLTSIKALAG